MDAQSKIEGLIWVHGALRATRDAIELTMDARREEQAFASNPALVSLPADRDSDPAEAWLRASDFWFDAENADMIPALVLSDADHAAADEAQRLCASMAAEVMGDVVWSEQVRAHTIGRLISVCRAMARRHHTGFAITG